MLSLTKQKLELPPLYSQRGQDFALVDGGAPAARYSGSAAGAGGQRDWGCGNCLPDFDERRASRVATHPPP